MLYYYQDNLGNYWIKDKNFSKFDFGPFQNIWIKGKWHGQPQNFPVSDLKTRQDWIGLYKKISFIKKNNKIKLSSSPTNQTNFDGLVLARILDQPTIDVNFYKKIENYSFDYQYINSIPGLTFIYINNLSDDLTPIINGFFGKYFFKLNIFSTINPTYAEKLEEELKNFLTYLENLKNNHTLIGNSIKKEIKEKYIQILTNYAYYITKLYILLLNSLHLKKNLKNLQKLPNILEEYKAQAHLLEHTLDSEIDKYILIYQRLTSNFIYYSEKLKKLVKDLLD